MASVATTLLKSSFLPKKAEWGSKHQLVAAPRPATVVVSMVARASAYADELVQTAVYIFIYIADDHLSHIIILSLKFAILLIILLQKTIASPGRGILAMDESNATCGKRLDSIGLENTEANRQAYRTLLVSAPGLGQYISGAILFEETLYQSTVDGKKIVDVLSEQGIVPGIKVDKVCTYVRMRVLIAVGS